MAETKGSKPAKSATLRKGAAGRTVTTEGERRGPLESPGACLRPRTKPATALKSNGKNPNQTEAKTNPNGNATKTNPNGNATMQTEPKGRTKVMGRTLNGSSQLAPHSRLSAIWAVPAASGEEEARKSEANRRFTSDELKITLPEPEFHDLPDLLSPPQEGSDKAARSEKEEAVFRKLEQRLGAFVLSRQLGQITGDALFDWPESNGLDLRPDLAFVSIERWARDRDVPKNCVWRVIPDLVVEIVRNSERTAKRSDWLEAYFRSGVNRVWIIYPEQLKIHDYDSLSSSRVLGPEDTIDGRAMLPGFQLPVKELLAE